MSDRSSDTMLLFFMKHMASVLVRTVVRILVLLECRWVSEPGVNERNLDLNIIYGQEKLHNKHRGLLESYSDSAHLATYGGQTSVVA